MLTALGRLFAVAVLFAGGLVSSVEAQAPSVCAQVKIEILQRITFERVAFEAQLAITNNLGAEPLNNLSVTLYLTSVDGEDVASLFFVRVSDLQNIGAIDGTGSIAPGVRAQAKWLIVPSAGLGGTEPRGKMYLVSGLVRFEVASGPKELNLFPAPIFVRPQPQLDIDYFLPATIDADDPFTEAVEAPVPATLGARVVNGGFGPAGNLRIESGQPSIVENVQGLLVGFRLLGASVNGQPVQPSLDVSLGTLGAGQCGVASWQLVSTLSGRFLDFNATYRHAPELGGELTSLVRSTRTNVLVREMLVDLPGRDGVRDFLADTDRDPENLPDLIFESNCADLPVNVVAGATSGRPTPDAPEVPLQTAVLAEWTYARVADPADGLIPLVSVIRSDGKVLRPENFWISRRQDETIKSRYHFFVNVVDFDSTGSYTLRYARPDADFTPPVTSLVFQAPSTGSAPTYVTPDTQILFTAVDDSSGVASIESRLDDDPGGFQPAFPFKIAAPGPHVIAFRSTDRAGNREPDRSATVVVDAAAPAVDPLVPAPAVITPAAPAGAEADRATTLPVRAVDDVPALSGTLEIARGTAAEFSTLPIVRSFPFTLRSGAVQPLVWDGADGNGVPSPEGTYTVRATVADPLGRASAVTATVQVREYLDQSEPFPAADADQQYPRMRGTRLVWQDNRNGDQDVYTADLAGGPATNLTAGQAADQTHPATDGRYVVWQDRRNGNWDIFLHDLTTGTTTAFAAEINDQEYPVVDAPWVVWQERRGGQYDIVARNIATLETVEVSAADTTSRDQTRPALSAGRIAFEDLRHGLGEIYVFDLGTRTERRITNQQDNQSRPTIDGDTVVWVDQRDQNRELYAFDLAAGTERRLTYTRTDEAAPFLRDGTVAHVDYAAGLSDPAIQLYRIATRRALRVTSDPGRQEEPTTDGARVCWQDDRTGRWQIRSAVADLEGLPIARRIDPGLNLVGISDAEAAAHPRGFDLLAAWRTAAGIEALEHFDPATGRMLSARFPQGAAAPEGDDFAVVAGDALIARAPRASSLALAPASSCAPVTVNAGANYVTFPCVPPGLSAKDVARGLGVGRVSSISRYDTLEGRWKALAVDGARFAGEEFPIVAGEGYVIYAKEAAPPYAP